MAPASSKTPIASSARTLATVVGALCVAMALSGCDKEDAKNAAAGLESAAARAGQAVTDAGKAGARALEQSAAAANQAVDAAKGAVADIKADIKADVKASISAEVQKQVDGYQAALTHADSVLAKVTDLPSAQAALSDLTGASAAVASTSAILRAIPETLAATVREQFGPTFQPIVASVKGHIQRLNQDPAVRALLGEKLAGFKFFE